jgi:hypothetical protein
VPEFDGASKRLTALCISAIAVVLAGCGPGARSPSPATTSAPSVTTNTTTAPTTVAPTTTSRAASFAWSAAPLTAADRARMTGVSWRPACPVSLDALRSVELSYWAFDGSAQTGVLVVNRDSVSAIVGAFRALFAARFPIRQMRPVEAFGGDDESSMAADNTSAFNCRIVPGSSTWSQHAYGRAVDIDPLENPEVRNGVVDPPTGAPWVDRTRSDPAIIRHGGAAWKAFASVGWAWGGDWVSLKDYQHFSANGL